MLRRKGILSSACVVIASFVVIGPAKPAPAQPQCVATECAKVVATDAACKDTFGVGTAISGDTCVIGASAFYSPGEPGAAYVFQYDGLQWIQVAKLTASDGESGAAFGHSAVAIDGDVILVGAPWNDHTGLSNAGSAYVFVRPPSGWTNMTETARLTASDANTGDYFGKSVAVDGDVIAVGAHRGDGNEVNSGCAYVFVKAGESWTDMTETLKLTASDGSGSDDFGYAIDISNDLVLVGAEWDDHNGHSNAGSAYVYLKPEGGWDSVPSPLNEYRRIFAGDPASNDQFGISLAIEDDTAVVGADGDDDGANWTGAAYVFERNAGGADNWGQVAKLTPSDPATNLHLGTTTAISGSLVVVGAQAHQSGLPGAAYLYAKPGTGWADMTETAKLVSSDGVADDYCGWASIDGDVVVVGAHGDDDASPADPTCDSGSAYFIHGASDCNTNGVMDICDLAAGTSPDCNYNHIPDECDVLSLDTSPVGLPLNSILVSAADPGGASFSVMLEDGVTYWLLAEGTWTYAQAGQEADAEWWYDADGGIWRPEHPDGAEDPYMELLVDGVDYEWWGCPLSAPDPLVNFPSYQAGAFSTSHTYWLPIIGNGAAVNLTIFDTQYADNGGELMVSIYSAEGPDCNGNGIPDECEPDCDGDRHIDDCDDDDDNDGVPDDEDICPATFGCEVMPDGRPRLDLNEDCEVNGLDISIIVEQILSGCSACE